MTKMQLRSKKTPTGTKNFYGGISGLQVDRPQRLYPPSQRGVSRLTYYASLFNSIEINSSFYKIPQENTTKKWTTLVGKDFKFTFKLFKDITHVKGFRFRKKDIENFFKPLDQVKGSRKGCLLIQFPPSLDRKNLRQVMKLLKYLKSRKRSNQWKLAIEFRNNSWYQNNIYKILEHYNCALVIHDMPKSRTPIIKSKVNFIYLRLHGPEGTYRGSYSNDFLQQCATNISEWLTEGKEVYVYFNNTMGDSFKNLMRLKELIKSDKGNKSLK